MKRKTNLLQRKIQVYKTESSEREVYETLNCFQLKVEDSANVIKSLAEESGKEESEVVDMLFEKMKNYHLYDVLEKKVDNRYQVDVKVVESLGTRSAHVKISKRSVKRKIREGIKSFFKEDVG